MTLLLGVSQERRSVRQCGVNLNPDSRRGRIAVPAPWPAPYKLPSPIRPHLAVILGGSTRAGVAKLLQFRRSSGAAGGRAMDVSSLKLSRRWVPLVPALFPNSRVRVSCATGGCGRRETSAMPARIPFSGGRQSGGLAGGGCGSPSPVPLPTREPTDART